MNIQAALAVAIGLGREYLSLRRPSRRNMRPACIGMFTRIDPVVLFSPVCLQRCGPVRGTWLEPVQDVGLAPIQDKTQPISVLQDKHLDEVFPTDPPGQQPVSA